MLRKKSEINLPGLEDILKGSLFKRYVKCGKRHCRCKEGELHGPYFYFSYIKDKKIYQIYIPKSKVKEVKRKLKNYDNLIRFFEEMNFLNVKKLKGGKNVKGKNSAKK